MAAMFVPRSVKRKEDNNLSRKSNFIRGENSCLKKIELIDERKSATNEKQIPIRGSDSGACTDTTYFPFVSSASETSATGAMKDNLDEGENEEEEETVSYSKNQRWPTPGEPVCVICGRYGAYIVDQTDKDVCSLECKARHLSLLVNCTTTKTGKELLDNKIDNRKTTGVDTNPSDGAVQISVAVNKFKFEYNEHPFIAKLSVSKVDDIRKALNIRVKGNDISKPVLEFKHCQLSGTLESNLAHFGYVTPTPVQMQVIPVGLCSRDVLACAHTGSGKTAAFLVPIIQRIYAEVGE